MVSGRQPTAHGSCAKACSSYSMFPPTQCGGDWIVRGKGGSRHWTKRPKGERTEVERNSHWVDKTRTTKNRVGRTTLAAKARPSHGTQGLALGEVKKGGSYGGARAAGEDATRWASRHLAKKCCSESEDWASNGLQWRRTSLTRGNACKGNTNSGAKPKSWGWRSLDRPSQTILRTPGMWIPLWMTRSEIVAKAMKKTAHDRLGPERKRSEVLQEREDVLSPLTMME